MMSSRLAAAIMLIENIDHLIYVLENDDKFKGKVEITKKVIFGFDFDLIVLIRPELET